LQCKDAKQIHTLDIANKSRKWYTYSSWCNTTD